MDTGLAQFHNSWKAGFKILENNTVTLPQEINMQPRNPKKYRHLRDFAGVVDWSSPRGNNGWDPASQSPSVEALAGIPGRTNMHFRVRVVRRSG